MRKFYFLLLIGLLTTVSLKAQRYGTYSLYHSTKVHEVSAGYGFGSFTHNHLMDRKNLSDYFDGTYYYLDAKSNPLGVLHVNYKYVIRDRFLASFHIGYDRNKADILFGRDMEKRGTARSNYSTVAVEGYYLFVDEQVQLYSGLGLGYSINKIKYDVRNEPLFSETHKRIDFNLTLIGFRYGYNQGFFIESSYGYKGFISAGAFIRL